MPAASNVGFRSLGELEAAARKKIGAGEWAYVQGGAEGERAVRANRAAFERRTLVPRVLTDVSRLDPSTSVLGSNVRLPFIICPMAHQEFLHPDAELATARAAREQGVAAAFSTLSARSLEEIAAAAGASPKWFQLYLQPTFSESRSLVERAERAGYRAIVLTVDMPVLGCRDGLSDQEFDIYAHAALGNGPQVTAPDRAPAATPSGFSLSGGAEATWSIVDDLISITRLPFVVKGVLSPEDAERAISRGARGVLVSNHGGRQLGAAPAALDVLEPIAQVVGTRAEVFVDGGVRRGSDVVLALALGARAVGLGRPVLWALAVDGQAGVERYLELLSREFVTALALCGCRRLSEIDRTLLGPIGPFPGTLAGTAVGALER